jgi:4'-phosphopantetheinyl transferase EntD
VSLLHPIEDCPHGRLIVGSVSPNVQPFPGELDQIAALAESRRHEFMAGRHLLRNALGQWVAIPSDDRGAPVVPAGWVGSISHKPGAAAAIAAPDTGARIGVDIERAAPPKQPIERRILNAREQVAITGARITLAFAIKEAIYKAIDPFVRRYVGFTEVELDLGDAGACTVTTELPFRIEAWWHEALGYYVATARASALP